MTKCALTPNVHLTPNVLTKCALTPNVLTPNVPDPKRSAKCALTPNVPVRRSATGDPVGFKTTRATGDRRSRHV